VKEKKPRIGDSDSGDGDSDDSDIGDSDNGDSNSGEVKIRTSENGVARLVGKETSLVASL
jgi:hypothetical protein